MPLSINISLYVTGLSLNFFPGHCAFNWLIIFGCPGSSVLLVGFSPVAASGGPAPAVGHGHLTAAASLIVQLGL